MKIRYENKIYIKDNREEIEMNPFIGAFTGEINHANGRDENLERYEKLKSDENREYRFTAVLSKGGKKRDCRRASKKAPLNMFQAQKNIRKPKPFFQFMTWKKQMI